MKFDIYKMLSLSFLGNDWKDCYINYNAISVREAKGFINLTNDSELMEKGISLLKSKFVDGKGISDGKEVDLKAEYIEDMPIQVVTRSIELLTNDVDKKKE